MPLQLSRPGLYQEMHKQKDKGGGPSPLLSAGEAHLQCCIQYWGSQSKRDRDILGQIQQRAMKMIKQLESLTYKVRLRELGLISLNEDFVNVYIHT